MTAEPAQTGPVLFIRRYWIVFQRQQTKPQSCSQSILRGEKFDLNIRNQSSSPTKEPKDQNMNRTWTSEPFQSGVCCPGSSDAKAPLSYLNNKWPCSSQSLYPPTQHFCTPTLLPWLIRVCPNLRSGRQIWEPCLLSHDKVFSPKESFH